VIHFSATRLVSFPFTAFRPFPLLIYDGGQVCDRFTYKNQSCPSRLLTGNRIPPIKVMVQKTHGSLAPVQKESDEGSRSKCTSALSGPCACPPELRSTCSPHTHTSPNPSRSSTVSTTPILRAPSQSWHPIYFSISSDHRTTVSSGLGCSDLDPSHRIRNRVPRPPS